MENKIQKYEVHLLNHGMEWELRDHDSHHRVVCHGRMPVKPVDGFRLYAAIRRAELSDNDAAVLEHMKEWRE